MRTMRRPMMQAIRPKERTTRGKIIQAIILSGGVDRDTQDHGADVLGGSGLKKRSVTAAGAITHVITHQIGNNSRIAGIIFGGYRLQLYPHRSAPISAALV